MSVGLLRVSLHRSTCFAPLGDSSMVVAVCELRGAHSLLMARGLRMNSVRVLLLGTTPAHACVRWLQHTRSVYCDPSSPPPTTSGCTQTTAYITCEVAFTHTLCVRGPQQHSIYYIGKYICVMCVRKVASTQTLSLRRP